MSCFFSLLIFSLIFSCLSSSVLSLLLHRVSSFISDLVLSFLWSLLSSLILSSSSSSLVLSFISDLVFFFSGLSFISDLVFFFSGLSFISDLVLSFLVLSLFLCFSLSVSLCFCLSVSVSVWWCVVSCGLCAVCCACWCGVVLWCVVVFGVWCGTQKKPPCVDSKRPRVYRHHARMYQNMRAWCRYTRGRFESTHGGFFGRTHGERERVSPSVLLTKFAPLGVITCFREVHRK